MPDISMCVNQACSLRARCHRYTAKADQYQCYFTDVAPNPKTGKCEYFWDNSDYTEERAVDPLIMAYRTKNGVHDETLALAAWLSMSSEAKQLALEMAARQDRNHPEPIDIFTACGLTRVKPT